MTYDVVGVPMYSVAEITGPMVAQASLLASSWQARRLAPQYDQGLTRRCAKGSATFYAPTESLIGPPTAAPAGKAQPLSQADQPLLQDALPQGLAGLPQGLATVLMESTAGLGKRSPQTKVRKAILKLCAFKPFQASELAKMLKRDQAHLTRSYLTPLVKKKKLEFTIPEEPAHPHQAYRTRQVPPPTSRSPKKGGSA